MIRLIQPTFNIQKTFVDRPAVMKAIERAEKQSMVKQLAYIRRRARSLLRRRKKVSEPEQPPSIHSKERYGLKTIFFGYQQTAAGGSGVVGPVRLNQVPFVRNSTTVPNALEEGGAYKILEEEISIDEDKWNPKKTSADPRRVKRENGEVKFWIRRDKRRRDRPGEETKKRWRRVQIRPRPFMMPALQAEIDAGTIMEPWHNSFHS